MIRSCIKSSVLFLVGLNLIGCFAISADRNYQGPPDRPKALLDYYSPEGGIQSFKEVLVKDEGSFVIKRLTINSEAGETIVDFYQQKVKNDNLVLVFPLLGGSNKICDYFADYYVRAGFDSAIVHRNNDFKDAALFPELETIFRDNVRRDRLAMDLFEKEYGKKNFGSFGISRGAINVVMTAGVDKRLKYNVIALGSTDLLRTMRNSNEGRIAKYRDKVLETYNISEDQFYDYLVDKIVTDPKHLSKYLDARHTLMFLGLLDKTVPIQYGVKLKQEIGNPKTVFLLADHYLSVAYTRLAKVAAPRIARSGVPFDYIESESVQFYKNSFEKDGGWNRGLIPFKVLQAPGNAVAEIVNAIF